MTPMETRYTWSKPLRRLVLVGGFTAVMVLAKEYTTSFHARGSPSSSSFTGLNSAGSKTEHDNAWISHIEPKDEYVSIYRRINPWISKVILQTPKYSCKGPWNRRKCFQKNQTTNKTSFKMKFIG